jgi:hypothetical protein
MDVKRLTVVLYFGVLRVPGENQEVVPAAGREGAGEPITTPGGQFLLRPEATEFKRGDLLSARYQIEKVIGRGATGCVLQAFDRVVRTVVALKILRPDLASDPRWVERLGGELRYARKLHHPNVCRVFDVGESNGHHFLTIEFASRGSLRQRLGERSAATRSWEDRIADARAVIDGLCAIHAENIVHRDVKPENVLVMDDGRLVVTDFGVAVALGSTTYFSSSTAGTPSYMAPEVITGEKATTASDVFSLGITLHEILFGRRPEWQITQHGKSIKPPVNGKASKRERAFATLIVECLREFVPNRLGDAAAVKKRFEQAVGGRLQPLRGRLHGGWPLVVGAVAVSLAATILWVGRLRRHVEPQPAALAPVARLLGKAVDLSSVSRSVVTSTKGITCFDVLSGGNTARLVWGYPSEAVDLNLATGQIGPAPLLPATYKTGCPRLSPDGRRLLYTETSSSGPRIVLSSHSDGADAQVITEGSFPVWLPSGTEFAYAFERKRGGMFSLPESRTLFKDTEPLEKQIQDIAVSHAGDRIAFLFLDARHESLLEVYGYPSMSLTTTARLTRPACCIAFDSHRQSLLVTVGEWGRGILTELRGPDLYRLGEIDGANVARAVNSPMGLAFFSVLLSPSVTARSPDGTERTFRHSGAYSTPVFSQAGNALIETRSDDGRLVISIQQWNGRGLRPLTSGPEDAFPSFGPTGNFFAYVRIDRNTVMGCTLERDLNTACRPIAEDPLGPRSIVLSPDGKAVAYHTAYGASSRIRVVPTSGGLPRDLGAHSGNCPIVWSAPTRLSAYDGERHVWREIDSATGKYTGKVNSVPTTVASPCDYAPRDPASRQHFEVRGADTVSVEIRVARDL